MYRFGDGTPFPLSENFIETLVAAVDCCVAIYQVEARVEEHQARVHEARRRAADELRRLDALHGLIDTAVAPLIAKKDERTGRASEQAAARILEAASTILRNSRAGVARRRETAEHETIDPAVLAAVPAALGQFFCRFQLPRTEWQAHWQAGVEGPATAEVSAQPARELELVFRASPPPDGFWGRPIPMVDLFKGQVSAGFEAPRGRTRQFRLDPMILTELQVAPGREAMVLRESGKRPGDGLHFLMPRPGEAGPLVVQLDKHDQSRGQPFYLDAAGAAAVQLAWRAVVRELPELIAARQELTAARLGGRAVSEIERPAQLAETILLSLGPIVREMRMRSRVPGELILKRDLGGDRREEMFVPRQALWNRLSALSPRHRQLFEAIGLSNEATLEFVSRVAQKAVRTRARPPQGAPDLAEPPDLPTLESYGFERDPDLIEAARPRPAPPAHAEATVAEATVIEEAESGVELTNPRAELPGPRAEESGVSVVSGLIERAMA